MKSPSAILLAASLLVGACDEAEPRAEVEASEPAEPPAASQPKPQPTPGAAKPQPTPPAAKASAAGGLALGEGFAAFDVVNSESGEVYCQICRYGSNPKLMAVGAIDDPAFKRDLERIDGLVDKFGADQVKAFAVVATAQDGALVTPDADLSELLAQAKALRAELELSFPVVVPARKQGQRNAVFEDYYQLRRSPTIMLVDRDNQVRYSEVAPPDLAALDAAIAAVVGT